jgi:phosphatidylglycerol:prolipoprotein diacylglycerol transferase
MFAVYLHRLSPFIFELAPGIGPRWYGMCYLLSFGIGFLLFRKLAQTGHTELPPEKTADFITWTAVFGVMLGGRLGWALFYGWREIQENPLRLLEVWKGGMSSHGGLLGVVLFTLFWSRKNRISWTSLGDSISAIAPVGIFLVRMANFINGELYGKPAGEPGQTPSVPWAVVFPQELESPPPLDLLRSESALRQTLLETLPPRHPSQIYEGLLEGVLLFLILWTLHTCVRLPRGAVTGIFFLLYPAARIFAELFREPDPAWSAGIFSAGQFLSLFLPVLGIAFLVWAFRARQYERAWN